MTIFKKALWHGIFESLNFKNLEVQMIDDKNELTLLKKIKTDGTSLSQICKKNVHVFVRHNSA